MTAVGGAIREFRTEDRPAVESLYREVFGEQTLVPWKNRFDWQFVSSPAAKHRPAELWVAEYEGDIVGFLASFPMRLSLNGREYHVLCPCDLMVSARARGLGLGQRLIERYLSANPVLANALQYSPSAERIYDRLKYMAVSAEPQYMRPYDVRRILEFRSSGTEAALARGRAALESVVGMGAAPVVAVLNHFTRPKKAIGVHVTEVTRAGAEFDLLWDRLRPAFTAVVVRDAAFVQWRFLDDPQARNSLFLAQDSSGRPLGYAATMKTTRRGVKFGYLLDMFVEPGADKVIDSLMAAALDWFENRDVAVVTCLGLHPAIRARVERALYVRPKAIERPARFLWLGEKSLESLVYDASNWHLSQADGDDVLSL